MTGLIDTHIHLDFLAAPGAQIDEARRAGVAGWVVPGTAPERWAGLMAAVAATPGAYAAPGVHPQSADRCGSADLERLRRLLARPDAVAVGEVGLDRLVDVPWQVQEELFRQMIRLALETGKPLLIHARRCAERAVEILRGERAERVGGVFHAFSGSAETARRVVDLNFALGIGGVATWPTARRLPAAVRAVPAEALVLETDAPDMAPEPHRGAPNRPAYLALVAERVAALRGWSLSETARLTSANACRVLRLPPPNDHHKEPALPGGERHADP